jgi:hypothetical protein
LHILLSFLSYYLPYLHFRTITVKMSAIPNLPESVLDLDSHNPEAASKQVQNNREAVQHFEYAQSNGTTTNGNKSEPAWALHDSPVENQRPLRVIVIGAGYSGIYLGIRIPERLRNVDLVIYEKNAGVGGTWYLYATTQSVRGNG